MSGKKRRSKDELIHTRIQSLGGDEGAGLILDSIAKAQSSQDVSLSPPDGLDEVGSSQLAMIDAGVQRQLKGESPAQSETKNSNQEPTDVRSGDAAATSIVANSDKLHSDSHSIDIVSYPEVKPDSEKTVVMAGLEANPNSFTKPVFGMAKPSTKSPGSSHLASIEAQVGVAEGVHFAQLKINELEAENERLRAENEKLHASSDHSSERLGEVMEQLQTSERIYNEALEQHHTETQMLRSDLRERETQVHRLQSKIDELNSRLGQDLRKIRVRERELENRLELAKLEKDALLRAKDDAILELKRRLDSMQLEMDSYKDRVFELNKVVNGNNEQLARTVRALRLALSNLESDPHAGASRPVPIKKAE